ncbi:hypothetical protein MHLP_02130 [Candidatus Mycoplasma haematolamae str. Purdue]|uniref:Uncharacterized protein n=1 Tax=Mycoplasma haematolamae (strain Purdue) TaxID=1212765 RepID=I7CFL8_MYCHA|nr:hypothetical protein [Candidatus Mycoplasma haematolamae]AFO52006.1 hypothetical protein MHLP_02130 [Candidatus Mycoplasma haematolamae str. Purdue]
MTFLPAKTIAAFFVGSGSVAGSGYGIVEYVRYLSRQAQSSTSKTVRDLTIQDRSSDSKSHELLEGERQESSSESVKGPEKLDFQLQPSTLSGSGTHNVDSSDSLDEDDEDLPEEKDSGQLFVVKGFLGTYELKGYFDGKRPEVGEEIVIEGVPFKGIKGVAKTRADTFNTEIWGKDDELSNFLKALEEKKEELKKVFEGDALGQLIRGLQEKVHPN